MPTISPPSLDNRSHYKDTPRRARMRAEKQTHYVDCGSSGVWGLAEGYSTMIAGAPHASNLTYPQSVDAALLRFQRSVKVAA